jgi:hypothetical protein
MVKAVYNDQEVVVDRMTLSQTNSLVPIKEISIRCLGFVGIEDLFIYFEGKVYKITQTANVLNYAVETATTEVEGLLTKANKEEIRDTLRTLGVGSYEILKTIIKDI